MGKGDISQLPFLDICDLCIHISRGKAGTGKRSRDHLLSRVNKYAVEEVSRVETCCLSDNFKIDILGSLSEQIDTLKIENKQKDENVALSIFCRRSRKKHALRECPLDLKSIETYVICAENQNTKECPFIPGLKAVFSEEGMSNQVESLYFVAKRPWKNPQTNQTKGFNPKQFAQSSQNNWNPPMPWQPWAQQQSWNQGWKDPYGRYSQYQKQLPPYPNFPPQYFPQINQLPQAQAQNENPQLSLPFSQRPNQLPIQPLPKTNNKTPHSVYNLEGQNPKTYMITPLDLNIVQLRSSRVLERKKPYVVIQETQKNSQNDNNNYEEEISLPQKENIEM